MTLRIVESDMKILGLRCDLSKLATYNYRSTKETDALVQKTFERVIHGSLLLQLNETTFSHNAFKQFCKAIPKNSRHRAIRFRKVSVVNTPDGVAVAALLRAISGHPSIGKLFFTESYVTDEHIPPIVEQLQKGDHRLLSHFSLAHNEICGAAAVPLVRAISETRTTLDLSHNYIDDHGLELIKEIGYPRIILKGNPQEIYSNNYDLKRTV